MMVWAIKLFLTVLCDNLLGQCQVVLAASAVGIVEDNGQAVAGALAQLHVALDDGLEDQLKTSSWKWRFTSS